MVNKKSKYISFAAIIILTLVIVLNIAFSFAYFLSYNKLSGSINFGTIKIRANETAWFNSTQNYYTSVKPNDLLLNEDIKFNLQANSQPVFIRVKYNIVTTSSNSEVLKVSNYLKYRELNLSTSSDYKWSEKKGEYYYLLDAEGNPLIVDEARNEDFVFLTKENSRISNDLEFDSTQVNDDSIAISIGVEAIQTDYLDDASENDLLTDIETELNNIYNVTTTGSFSVTFDVNGTKITQTGISYGASVDIPNTIQLNNIEGFSLWDNGLVLIKTSTNNHTFISNNKINNITEDITLYVAGNE